MTRFWRVIVAAARAFIGPRRTLGARLCQQLEALGGAWVKVGQTLSMRYELLPADICDALRPLQGRMAGVSGGYGATVATRELGSLDMFADFPDAPIAAATIGQVHKARLRSGETVAVKVIRPHVRELYAADLTILSKLAWLIDHTPFLSRYRMRDMVIELRGVLAEELDFRFEAHHMHELRPVLQKRGVRVPKVYRQWCTSDLLVSAWVEGVTMSDVLAMPDLKVWLRTKGLSAKRIGRTLLRALNWLILWCNRFHGDLHPGNLIIGLCGRLFAIDFGTTSATERRFLDRFTTFLQALSTRNHAKAADVYCLLCVWPAKWSWQWAWAMWRGKLGRAEARRDLVRVMTNWAARTPIKTLPFVQKSIGQLSIDLMTVIRTSGGAMDWAWLKITRAYSTVEMTVGALWSAVDHVRELTRFMNRAAEREQLDRVSKVAVANGLTRLLAQANEYIQLNSVSLHAEGIVEGL